MSSTRVPQCMPPPQDIPCHYLMVFCPTAVMLSTHSPQHQCRKEFCATDARYSAPPHGILRCRCKVFCAAAKYSASPHTILRQRVKVFCAICLYTPFLRRYHMVFCFSCIVCRHRKALCAKAARYSPQWPQGILFCQGKIFYWDATNFFGHHGGILRRCCDPRRQRGITKIAF